VVVPFIALWADVFRLDQSPAIMPNSGVFIDVGGVGAIVFSDYFGTAATIQCAGCCG
jgi:hypothetical protein